MNFPALGIRPKLALTTLMSLLPLLLLGVALSVYLISDTLRQNNLHHEDIAFTSIDHGLKFETPMMDGDILFLVTLPPIQEILRARAHQGVDPISGFPLEKLLQRLQGVFSHFLVTQELYDQIQFIDKSGQEVVRIDLAGDRAEVIPPAQLQYKGDRYYFQKATKLPPGEVYISPIDLNREWGKLEQPLKPMLRIVTPIHDAAGIFQGVLVLNKFADRFLSQIMQATETIGGLWFMADDRGYYVYHSQDPERLWGGPEDLNTGEGLCKDFPQQCQQLLSGKNTSVTLQGRTWLVHPRRYNLWPGHARFITIAHMTPQPGFADYLGGDTWLLIGGALLAALLAGLSTWWNGRRISRPIQNLAAAMQQFRQGQRGARAKVTSRDEIGALCEDFNAMADTLTQVTDNLEEEVTKGTLDLLITTNKLQALIQASPVAIISLDLEGKVTSWNKSAEILFGWTEAEVLGKPLPIILEEEQEQFQTMLRDIRGGEGILRVETRRRRKDGAIIEVSRSTAPVLDAAGKVIGVIGLLEDITTVRQAQKALQESEAFNRTTLNSISEHLAVLDGNGVILRTNKTWEDFAAANGLSQSLIGENYLALCDRAEGPGSDEARLAAQGIREVMQGNLDIFSLEYSCHSPDEQCWFQMRVSPFGRGGETGVVVAHLNISRLKETERELQRLLEQLEAGRNLLQAVLEQMPAGVIIAESSPGRIILSNRRAEGLWEQPPGFLTDLEKFLQIPRYCPDGRAYPRDDIPLLRALTRGETIMDEEMLVERETGDRAHYIHLNVNAAPVRDSQGKIIAGVVTFLDITQRWQAELALRQSQEQMRLLLESTEQGIYGIDLDGGCTFINRAALEMLQYSRPEVMGKSMHHLIHHTHADGTLYPEADCPVDQVLRTGIGGQLDDEALWRRDGSVFPAHYSFYPLKSEGRIIGAVVSFSDITARKHAEEALRESEERFRTLVELAPDIIYRLDEAGRILFISPAVRQLGYQPEDLVGRKFEEIVYPEDRQRAPHTFVERRIGERAMKNLEIRLTTKEGDLRDYSLNFHTFSLYSRGVWNVPDDQIMVPEKKFLCSQGIARDISDLKRAEVALRERKEQLQLLLESTGEGIYGSDLEGRCTFINRAGAEMLLYPADLYLGQKIHELIHHSYADGSHYPVEECPLFKALLSGKSYQSDMELLWRQDGTSFPVHFSSQPILREGRILGAVVVFADITQRKQTEEALTVAKGAAEAANRAKSDFLSSMSHELRTPMNAIIGFSEILQDQYFGPLNEKQSRQINHILTSGRHLLSLINDILDLSKVESGKMTLELTSVGIADLVQNSLVMIKEKALKHQLHLETDLAPDLADLRIVADERKLRQIMFNLLSNAAKYTPDGGEIKVTAKREAGNLVVSVADTGIGTAPEDQERIFEAFERVDSSYARQQEGTGLGLALTRRMVELHRGRIWVESAGKDKGSTFIFIIPLRSGVEPETLPNNNA